METFLITIIISLIYSVIFLGSGIPLLKNLLGKTNNHFNNFYFISGAGFFTGSVAFLFIWSVLTSLSKNAAGSFFVTSLLAVAWIFVQRRNLAPPQFSLKRSGLVLGLIAVMLAFGIFHSLVPMPRYFVTNPELTHYGAGFRGVAHSFRAGNLTNYIVSHNYFPRVNQNSGQSILAAIPAFFGDHAPQLALVIWLQIFISALAVLIYGLAKCFIKQPVLALLPALAVMLGNPALSPFFWNIADTGNISLLVYNVDSLISTASLLILFILLYLNQKNLNSKWILGAVLVATFTWSVVGGHAIPLFGASLIFIWLVFWRQHGVVAIIPLAMAFLIGSIVGIITIGGLLIPTKYIDQTNIPGMEVVQTSGVPALTLRFPRTFGNPPLIFSALAELRKLRQPTPVASNNVSSAQINSNTPASNNSFSGIVQRIKNSRILFALAGWARSLQLIFFPLLGIALTAIFLYKQKLFERSEQDFLAFFFPVACFTFAVGWVISTCFALYGHIFPLSRFIGFGVLATMFLLGVALAMVFKRFQQIWPRAIVVCVFCFIIFGALTDYLAVGTMTNIYFPPPQDPVMQSGVSELDSLPPLTLKERFSFLIYSQATYGTAVPK